MIVVFAIDALEYGKVLEFDCPNLKQKYFGKTDITEFSEPRTIILWSSFMTGENKEKEILAKGNKEMWNTTFNLQDTFFSKFRNPRILDLPGYSYDKKVHDKSRKLMKKFFESESDEEKETIKQEYNKDAFDHHKKIKKEFFAASEQDHDFLLGYFSFADVIGHLNFGNTTLMRMVYKELDEMASLIAQKCRKLLIISDHGMEAIGRFGDHSRYGFWSTNFKDLGEPRITEFGKYLIPD